MLVGERMSQRVIITSPDTPIHDALLLMQREHIRRLPVIHHNHLVGIVSEKDLLFASPSAATSLSVWELNYLLSKVKVSEVMTRKVFTATEETPIEEAARVMIDNKIGCLPVLRDTHLIGIITATDLFRIFLELLGARTTGVRVTALIPDTPGQLEKLLHAIATEGGNVISMGTFAGEDPSNSLVTFKVAGMTLEQIQSHVEPVVERVIDLRVC